MFIVTKNEFSYYLFYHITMGQRWKQNIVYGIVIINSPALT